MNVIKKVFLIMTEEGFGSLVRRFTGRLFFSLRAMRVAPKLGKRVQNMVFSTGADALSFAYSEMPVFLQPSQIRYEIAELIKRLEEMKPRNIVEIGTANGGTLFLLLRTAQPGASIVSIDWSGRVFGRGYPRWKTKLYNSYKKPRQKLSLLLLDSHSNGTRQKVIDVLQKQEVDFLFIDGDHSYEGVKKDFEMYFPLVRKGGLAALHDIAPHVAASNCEVKKYWDEIKSGYRHEEFISDPGQEWAGIGVIYK